MIIKINFLFYFLFYSDIPPFEEQDYLVDYETDNEGRSDMGTPASPLPRPPSAGKESKSSENEF